LIGYRPKVIGLGTISLDTIEIGGHAEKDVLGVSDLYFGAAARLFYDFGYLDPGWRDISLACSVRIKRGKEYAFDQQAKRTRPAFDT
jgi:hypothetical protein